MGNLIKIVIVITAILIFSLGVTKISAYTIEYNPIGFNLKKNPTICAFEPTDSDLSKKEIEKLFDQTRIAVSEWQVQLQHAVIYQENKDLWKINYMQIEKMESDMDANCDIKIYYFKKPEIPLLEHQALGVAKLDPLTDTWDIEIYYSEMKLEKQTKEIGNTIYYWYVPYYTDNLQTERELGNTIRHEIGHALGLGHYQADDVFVTLEWSQGQKPAPSMMVPFGSQFTHEQKIVSEDVEKLRSIYGENGFTSFSNVDKFESFKGKALIEKDYFDEALSYSEKYLKTNPNDEEILYIKGEAIWGLDRYSDAEKIMDDILKMSPENDGALYTKAKALAKSENYNQAMEYLDKVLKINPHHDKALSYKGLVYEKQEMYEDAENQYLKAYDLNPFNTTNLNRYADLLSDFGLYEAAVFYYERALLAEPDDVGLLYDIAFALEELEMFDEADQYYKKAEQIENQEPIVEQQASTEPEIKTNPDIVEKPQIPDWIRNNAEWWAQGAIGDSDFSSGIEYLIKEDIMQIPETSKSTGESTGEIPSWIKNNADWWSQGLISDDDFVKGIQYLVENGIIQVG